jgi:hypothetical protein
MAYPLPPALTVSSGNAAYDRFVRYTGMSKFEIDTAGLAAYMKQNGGGNFNYTVTLRVPRENAGSGEYSNSTWTDAVYVKTITVTAPPSAQTLSADEEALAPQGASELDVAAEATVVDAATNASGAEVSDPAVTEALDALAATPDATATEADATNAVNASEAAVEEDADVGGTAVEEETDVVDPPASPPATGTLAVGTPLILSTASLDTKQGQTIEVPVSLEGNTSLWGILASVDYDRSVLELQSYTVGSVMEVDQFTFNNDLTTVPYRFLATRATLDDNAAAGTLLTLTFKVKGDILDQESVIAVRALQVVNAQSDLLSTAQRNGKLTIGNPNGDGDDDPPNNNYYPPNYSNYSGGSSGAGTGAADSGVEPATTTDKPAVTPGSTPGASGDNSTTIPESAVATAGPEANKAVGLPWWGWVIVIAALVAVAGIGTALIRQRQRAESKSGAHKR